MNFFELPKKEQDKIIKEAAREANKEQQQIANLADNLDNIEKEIYRIIDTLLVKPDKQEPIWRLNQDRHLAAKKLLKLFKYNLLKVIKE